MPYRFTLVLLLLGAQIVIPVSLQAESECRQPNFLIIASDDHRYDSMEPMSFTREHVLGRGLNFTNAYITTPLCCPSRVSILTGRYASRHRVIGNSIALKHPLIAETLQAGGYRTALIGKFLNSWDGSTRPEFDYWVTWAWGNLRSYFNPRLNVNGRWERTQGYTTDLLRDYALEFLNDTIDADQPFFLFFTPNAPHRPVMPAPRHREVYANKVYPRPPSFGQSDPSKPFHGSNVKRLTRLENRESNLRIFRQLQDEALLALDEAVRDLVLLLETKGALENTVVIFLSDNGLMFGEHNLWEKDVPYEEATHVPFGILAPSLIPTPRADGTVVGNIDIAPTVLDLACLERPWTMDGVSLTPLFDGESIEREGIFLEGHRKRKYIAYHTDRFVYIYNQRRPPELYDLLSDPFQMNNLASANRPHELQDEFKAVVDRFQNSTPALRKLFRRRKFRRRKSRAT